MNRDLSGPVLVILGGGIFVRFRNDAQAASPEVNNGEGIWGSSVSEIPRWHTRWTWGESNIIPRDVSHGTGEGERFICFLGVG